MKKKLIGVLMGTAVAAVALTGCGNKKSETEAPATEKTTEAAVATEATEKTTTAEEGVLVVGFDAEYPPYGYMDDNGDYTGFDLELAEAVCALVSYVDNSQVIVVAEDAGIDDLAGLEGKTVGVQAASAALTLLEEDQKELADTFAELQQFADYNSAFVELQAGSIDAIAMDIGVAQYQIKSRDGFKILDESLNAEQYAVGFKKGNEELAQIVNADLQVLLENGTFDELAEKYELTDMVCLAEAFDDAEAETEAVTE